jgi:hypothetical protein
MEEVLGVPTLLVTLGCTMLMMGFAAFMTGQAIASTWRPLWQIVPYAVLLGCADRFLVWGLFGGALWSLSGWLIDMIYLFAVAFGAFRMTRARKMVQQYPWIYERAGPFAWRQRSKA